jgi:tetratricopeptide (TPR) repeat protein
MTRLARVDGRGGTLAQLVAIALLGSAVVWLQMERERRFTFVEPAQQILYVSSPAVMTRMALSYDALVADLYWIRAIQHYGGTRLSARPASEKRYELLYPLLDLTTSLDTHFSIAYRFGAFFLSEKKPGGAGRPDLAIRLLEKAMAANPDRWEYPHDIGFVHYRQGDYKMAAQWFQRASEIPGATNWLKPLAAVTLATGGDTHSSRLLWSNLLGSEAEWLRRTAQHRLLQLDAIEQIAELERLTADYERRYGDPPAAWDDMIDAGMLRGVPVDPGGRPYVLNPWWGDVTVAEDSPMWPLPTERPA